ncbi:Bug family tripartite tricarboxylate transporter substrate binding protein [Ottowia thiooxydans]|uniref:Bug family tripartite tricarboxylate transporter substrate binding protein n=1 Tax=Ottowia thiooxydans TaxID=219182 RepID=UPI00040EEF40|nr:tripartite tricarboxylate transporter substrate binding protein [Ottowia thiooxydans]
MNEKPCCPSSSPITRRSVLQLLGAGAAISAPVWSYAAAAYPTGPVTLVVPFSAGGQFDSIGRAVALAMAPDLGKPMLVENTGGAGGTIAGGKVARAKPDGQTLLLYGGNLATAGDIYKSLDYDPLNDFQAISRLSFAPHVIMASPSSGMTTFKQLRDKVNGGAKLSYGSPGVGTSMHLTFELVKQQMGLDILHVPYKGGANVMTDLIAGNIDLGIIAIGPALNFIKSKKVVPLGLTSKARSKVAPEIPSLSELGLTDLDTGSWAGLSAPKATPANIVERLNQSVLKALQSADLKRMFEEQGFIATPTTPAQMKEFAVQEAKAFSSVIRNLKL